MFLAKKNVWLYRIKSYNQWQRYGITIALLSAVIITWLCAELYFNHQLAKYNQYGSATEHDLAAKLEHQISEHLQEIVVLRATGEVLAHEQQAPFLDMLFTLAEQMGVEVHKAVQDRILEKKDHANVVFLVHVSASYERLKQFFKALFEQYPLLKTASSTLKKIDDASIAAEIVFVVRQCI